MNDEFGDGTIFNIGDNQIKIERSRKGKDVHLESIAEETNFITGSQGVLQVCLRNRFTCHVIPIKPAEWRDQHPFRWRWSYVNQDITCFTHSKIQGGHIYDMG